MKNWLKFLFADLAALLLGITITFAFAPYEVFPLAAVAPAGLLALWRNVSPSRAFWLGFVFGLGMFTAGVYWIFTAIHTFGDVSVPLTSIITGGLIVIMAAFIGTVGSLLNRYFPTNNTTRLLFAFPALWVFGEWIRSWIFTGFPWLLLGYSQTNSPLKGYAAILGVYGVSLAVVMTGALILNAVYQYKQKEYRNAYFNLFAFICIWLAGTLFSYIPWTKPTGNAIPVSLVQGNIPQSIKWSPEHIQLSFDTYQKLTEPLWGKSKLIFWPEAAIPMPIRQASTFIEAMDQKAQANDTQLILGIPIRSHKELGYYNSIVTLGKDKRVYSKRHLVPFGEYTPFSTLFSNLFQVMNIPMSDMVSGDVVQSPLELGHIKILAAICYEIAYPELFDVNDKTISMLLTATNDAWFGKSNAQAQHLQMAQMRSLELGRPMIFVSNDGITALINAKGQIESTLPQHTAGVLNGSVQPMYGVTPWMFNGMDPILFILLCLLGRAIWEKRKTTQRDSLPTKENTTYIHADKEKS